MDMGGEADHLFLDLPLEPVKDREGDNKRRRTEADAGNGDR